MRVTPQVPLRDDTWANTVEGVITSYHQAKTGAWFAHSRDDKLWLELRLDDGEMVTLNLDQYSRIEPVQDAGVD